MTNPMRKKCGAHCRTTGQPCKSSAMANGRCRMHGGKSTGRPQTTGVNTKAVREGRKVRQETRQLLKAIRELGYEVAAEEEII